MNRNFVLIYSALALAIALYALSDPGWHYAFLKPIPIWMLLAIGLRSPLVDTNPGRALLLGLVASSIGDILLSLPIELSLVLGIAAFFVAQSLYTANFLSTFRFQVRRLWLALLIVAWAICMALWLVPNTGELFRAILMYLAVITLMGIAAAFRAAPALTVFAGALAFILSDSLIAIDRFIESFAGSGFWIMASYYLAQFLIVSGSIASTDSEA